MDELDPLIASLEEFINHQHSPPYVPEDEVLRYPVSFSQRRLFQEGMHDREDFSSPSYDYGNYRRPKSFIHDQQPTLPAVSRQFLGPTAFDCDPNFDHQFAAEKSRATGRNTWQPSRTASRPTILPKFVPADPSDIDRELDALTNQVRQLQLQNEMLQRNTADTRPKTQVTGDRSSSPRTDLKGITDRQPIHQTIKRERTQLEASADYNRKMVDHDEKNHFRPARSVEDRQNPTTVPFHQVVTGSPNISKDGSQKKSSLASTSSTSSSSSSNGEVSVDEPYQYEDFIDSALCNSYLDDSLSKLQNIMRDLEENPMTFKRPFSPQIIRANGYSNNSTEESNTHDNFSRYAPQENGLPESRGGHPPLPPTRKPRNGPAPAKIRRHHTISSGNPSGLYAGLRGYQGDRNYSDNETMSDEVIPSSRKSSVDEEDSVIYDLQFRLNSPDPIDIPERYLDMDLAAEEEDEGVLRKRKAKAEIIRRMLAVPEPGATDRDQRDREKVLHMTPILAREVTERSRRVALQAKNRSVGR